jgi:deoxycytidylate deaminase
MVSTQVFTADMDYLNRAAAAKIEADTRQKKWDLRFLEMARMVSSWSKDPSTKTGAVLVDLERRIVSVGYNGFARGVQDLPERYENRELKYKMIVHCTAPSHRTLTKNLTWVPLGSLKIGDELIAFDEHQLPGTQGRRYRRSFVTYIEFTKEPVFRVILDTGQEIITTAEHKWLTTPRIGRNWRWTRTDEMKTAVKYKGHYVTHTFQVLPVFNTAQDYDSGWLAGFIDGEGHLGAHNTLQVAQRPGVVLDTALDILKEKGRPYSLRLVNSVMRGGLGRGDTRCVNIRGKLPDRLAFLGSIRPKRLLQKMDPETFGRISRYGNGNCAHAISRIVPDGEQEIVKVTTSTGTLFIEGYPMHNCERNAMQFANRDFTGSTLYTWPFMSCAPCAAHVINAGIVRCVAPRNNNPRWQADFLLTEQMFAEAAVKLDLIDPAECAL